MKTESTIVLNGSYHQTLTIARSLAKRGISVIVGDESKGLKSYFGEAMLSKYVSKRFLYPSPQNFPEDFIRKINQISRQYGANVLFPVGADTYVTISAYRDLLSKDIKMVLADDTLIQRTHDKYECVKYAESIGIHVPQTLLLNDISDGEDLKKFGVPLIVKPRRGSGNFGVKIVDTASGVLSLKDKRNKKNDKILKKKYVRVLIYDDSDFLVQEFVDGHIVDACTICNKGKVKAILTQLRVKTLPPEGGYGVMNRTVSIPEVRDMAEHLLTGLRWHGVAQIEFKYDTKSGQYKLMEFNPKFWGTLGLAVAAGIDFPYLAFRIAAGEEVEERYSFAENCVFRWVIPNEFGHVLQSTNRKNAFKQFIWDFFKPSHYNFDLRDPLPILSLSLKSVNVFKNALKYRK